MDPDDAGFYDTAPREPWKCQDCVIRTRKCKRCGQTLVACGGPLEGWVECEKCKTSYHITCLTLLTKKKIKMYCNSVNDMTEKVVGRCPICGQLDLETDSEDE